VAVLGTSFNVNAALQQTVVTCFSGTVSVANKESEGVVTLTTGLETVVKGDEVSQPYHAATDKLDQGLNFNHVPLWKVFETLAKYHGKHIVVPGGIDSVSFTGNLEGSSLESALKTVCLSAGLQFTIMADSAIIR
jgi:ferric-dicitrate binding protein FerR (iron transport regulator)